MHQTIKTPTITPEMPNRAHIVFRYVTSYLSFLQENPRNALYIPTTGYYLSNPRKQDSLCESAGLLIRLSNSHPGNIKLTPAHAAATEVRNAVEGEPTSTLNVYRYYRPLLKTDAPLRTRSIRVPLPALQTTAGGEDAGEEKSKGRRSVYTALDRVELCVAHTRRKKGRR